MSVSRPIAPRPTSTTTSRPSNPPQQWFQSAVPTIQIPDAIPNQFIPTVPQTYHALSNEQQQTINIVNQMLQRSSENNNYMTAPTQPTINQMLQPRSSDNNTYQIAQPTEIPLLTFQASELSQPPFLPLQKIQKTISPIPKTPVPLSIGS